MVVGVAVDGCLRLQNPLNFESDLPRVVELEEMPVVVVASWPEVVVVVAVEAVTETVVRYRSTRSHSDPLRSVIYYLKGQSLNDKE